MIKSPTISSLYGRIFAVFWLTLLLVLAVVLFAQQSDPRQLRDLSEFQSRFHANLIKKVQQQVVDASSLMLGLENAIQKQDEKQRLSLYFTTPSGELLFKNEKTKRNLLNFSSQVDDPTHPKERSYGRWLMMGPFLIEKGTEKALMYIGFKKHNPPPLFMVVLDRPFYLILITMLISTPLLLWLAWMVTRPARSLQRAADKIIKGHFEIDKELEKGPSEFRKAGASFNQMVSSINHMMVGQQRLLSDISHELRSPLTRLRMANALAIRKQGESAELNRINTEAERMELMISDLLSLSRMQLNSQVERDNFSVEELWQPMLEDAEFEAKQYGKKLVYSNFPNAEINGNQSMLYSAFENVVRNAIKYASSLIEVNIALYPEKVLVITVSDDGVGVPEENLEDIFRPFYRVSHARDRQSGGTGLGLAITYSAMHQHNGFAEARLNAKGGLTVTLTFNLS